MASSFIVANNGSFTVTPVTGTDVAGNSFTIDAGQGTGSGAGGSLTFRTAKAGGSTGTGANAYTDRLSINEDGVVDVKTTLAIGGNSVTASAAELNILAGVTATAGELNILDGVTATTAELNILAGVTATAGELNILDGVTATTAELNYVAGVTAGTAAASKALVLDAQSDISGINNIETATATFTGGLDVKNGATSGGVINLFEDSDNGTNKITLKAANAIAADFILTLPNADGVANQFLQTDGSGNLSFADPTAGAIGIDDLSDAKAGGTDFSNSIILGHETTGTLAAASNNTAFGIGVIDAITSGTDNVAVGYNAGTALTSGANNTLVGSTAGDAVTGSQNTIVGSGAGSSGTNDLVGGSNNTIIGYNAAASSASVTNEITLGNGSITALRCADTTIASLSDRRDKTNIVDSVYGIDFLETLRPVQFTWQTREGAAKDGKDRVGFIAQELQDAMPNGENETLDLVYEANEDRLEIKQGNLIPIMVKAIQELKSAVDVLKEENSVLRSQVAALSN